MIKGKAGAAEVNERSDSNERSETTIPARAFKTARDTMEVPRTHVSSLNNISENQAYKEKEHARTFQTMDKSLLQKTTVNTSQTPIQAKDHDPLINRVASSTIEGIGKQGDEEDQQLMSTEEMNQYLDQYASVDIEMDENMIDDDDLLDEMEEEEADIPETQEMVVQTNQNKEREGLGTTEEEADKAVRSGREVERQVKEKLTKP
ncbi:hypothetical protein Rs2_29249 [Raphanus sativus]|nr:hypothetical protein Rs2_29249 [Raphanus sativus]